ncbi:hypothetical protein BJV82DRAFT_248646 [Fennellomyces sp. T-0311]|nr:hypothetical protein BJV82DRAFT_248646 [Fennellomyces sp. T-0311]
MYRQGVSMVPGPLSAATLTTLMALMATIFRKEQVYLIVLNLQRIAMTTILRCLSTRRESFCQCPIVNSCHVSKQRQAKRSGLRNAENIGTKSKNRKQNLEGVKAPIRDYEKRGHVAGEDMKLPRSGRTRRTKSSFFFQKTNIPTGLEYIRTAVHHATLMWTRGKLTNDNNED